MSWQEFENTLPKSEKLHKAFPKFKEGLTALLKDKPGAILESEQLSQFFEIQPDATLDLLVLMEKENLIKPFFSWECKNKHVSSLEADQVSEFPSFLKCERCGEIHEFGMDCISIQFVATGDLLNFVKSLSLSS